jgi:hypothetical protein
VFFRVRGAFSGVFVQRVPHQAVQAADAPAAREGYGDKGGRAQGRAPRESKSTSGNRVA